MQSLTFEQRKFNLIATIALEQIDQDKAILALECPETNLQELTAMLDDSLMGRIINAETKEPIKLSNKSMMAIMRNVMGRGKELEQLVESKK